MIADRWRAIDTKDFYYNIYFDNYNLGQAADNQADTITTTTSDHHPPAIQLLIQDRL